MKWKKCLFGDIHYSTLHVFLFLIIFGHRGALAARGFGLALSWL